MKIKIALYKNVKYGYEHIRVIEDVADIEYWEKQGEEVRHSHVLEVELNMLDLDKIIKQEVAIIDNQMTKVRADMAASITALEGKKQELLAISHED